MTATKQFFLDTKSCCTQELTTVVMTGPRLTQIYVIYNSRMGKYVCHEVLQHEDLLAIYLLAIQLWYVESLFFKNRQDMGDCLWSYSMNISISLSELGYLKETQHMTFGRKSGQR